MAELELSQGFLPGGSGRLAAVCLKLRVESWLEAAETCGHPKRSLLPLWGKDLQLPGYQGLLLNRFVSAQQGALFSVLKIFGVGCRAFSFSSGAMVKWFPLPFKMSKLPNH